MWQIGSLSLWGAKDSFADLSRTDVAEAVTNILQTKRVVDIEHMTFEEIQEMLAKDEHRCLELKKTTGEL